MRVVTRTITRRFLFKGGVVADKYQWSYTNMCLLYGYTQQADKALGEALVMLHRLIQTVQADAEWSGDNKTEFMEWMDLVRQFHEKVADPGVGAKALEVLTGFLQDWSSYYSSGLPTSLEEVQ